MTQTIFTLEALRAKQGDSLILHFGDAAAPRFIVIDGGPPDVYEDALRPRLDELIAKWGDDEGKLTLDVLMISHLDDDHICGILDLTNDLLETKDVTPSPFRVGTLWHNAFEDVASAPAADPVAAAVDGAAARIAAADGEAPAWEGWAQAVVATIPHARQLRDNARGLGWEPNAPFGALVSAPASGARTVDFGPLRLTIVGPQQKQVDKLHASWEKNVRELEERKKAKELAEPAEYLDRSVYNLSSIVCLAELDGKRMLLTGDALGKFVLKGLEDAGLLEPEGTIELDVLKLPHHGSSRNVEQRFFERLRAKHLVISADGTDDNPELETLQMISAARPDDDFTIHLTYERFKGPTNGRIDTFLAQERKDGRTYEVLRRPAADLSLRVDLLDPVDY